MTVPNAVKGLKNVIQYKEGLIVDLDKMTRNCKDECTKDLMNSVKNMMIKDVGSCEWILSELSTRISKGKVHGK
jgi:DNA-directed RNA polymerase subunit E'/Rpb7